VISESDDERSSFAKIKGFSQPYSSIRPHIPEFFDPENEIIVCNAVFFHSEKKPFLESE